jgi:hypothetical protein
MSKDLFFKQQSQLAYYINKIQKEHLFSEYSTRKKLADLLEIRFAIKVNPEDIQNLSELTLEEQDILLTNKTAGYYGIKI